MIKSPEQACIRDVFGSTLSRGIKISSDFLLSFYIWVVSSKDHDRFIASLSAILSPRRYAGLTLSAQVNNISDSYFNITIILDRTIFLKKEAKTFTETCVINTELSQYFMPNIL
jgi:hypothetical protein